MIARRGRTLVFCEVKSRTTDAFGVPAEAVTRTKQARLRRLAARWLASGGAGRLSYELRFDVAAIVSNDSDLLEPSSEPMEQP